LHQPHFRPAAKYLSNAGEEVRCGKFSIVVEKEQQIPRHLGYTGIASRGDTNIFRKGQRRNTIRQIHWFPAIANNHDLSLNATLRKD
jgi:hypothetical protein